MADLSHAQTLVMMFVIMLALTALARRLAIPYPIMLVLGGLALGFVPRLTAVQLAPDLVFLVFLPPILWAAAYFTSLREFRRNLRPISLLAIGLVLATTAAVAVVIHAMVPGMSWAVAFALGAIVSPPDAVAATAIGHALPIPRRVVVILEGESLVNDASALVIYRTAVAAAVTGEFILNHALVDFAYSSVGGVLIGLVVGWTARWALRKLDDGFTEIAATLIAPYVAWVLAEQLHTSAVLACVAGGIYLRWHYSAISAPATRLQARAVWEQLIFLLNGLIFILIGLQLPSIIIDLGRYPFTEILGYGLLISLVTILIRIIWVFGGAYWLKIFKPIHETAGEIKGITEPDDTWKNVMVVAWTGTRGVISLAAALALPLVMEDGHTFPKRHSIIFLAFVVIFVTLVIQGLSLPLLIRWLKIKPQDNEGVQANELHLHLASSTLHFIETELELPRNVKFQQQLKNKYEAEIQQLTKVIKRHKKANRINEAIEEAPPDELYLAQVAISKFQRELLLKVHKEGEFSDTVIRQVEREMDIDELKLNLQVPPEE